MQKTTMEWPVNKWADLWYNSCAKPIRKKTAETSWHIFPTRTISKSTLLKKIWICQKQFARHSEGRLLECTMSCEMILSGKEKPRKYLLTKKPLIPSCKQSHRLKPQQFTSRFPPSPPQNELNRLKLHR
jgi:hypothetical protein